MATVYLAQDLKHRRKVAIKVLKPELAAALGPERFLQEIEIAAGHKGPRGGRGERGGARGEQNLRSGAVCARDMGGGPPKKGTGGEKLLAPPPPRGAATGRSVARGGPASD